MSDTPSDRPVALVTGATDGIGHGIAIDLARDHLVYAVGRRDAALAGLAEIPHIRPIRADLAEPADRAAIAAAIDRVDVIVHCAAIGPAVPLPEAPNDVWENTFQVNVFAPAELTRRLLPALRASRGTVVFIGSGASTKPVPNSIVYTASKHALRGLADVLRIDEAANGIRVSTVAPGPTDTPRSRAAHQRAGTEHLAERNIHIESVVRAVRFVIEADDDVHLTDVAVRPRMEPTR
jgi:NAD(P)-dependent dehydrogenase (short-subunit alcohol dehydrogenase family)